jgi:hypothetical protein
MTRTRLLHSAGGSLSVGGVEMSVLSCLLDISPNQVQTIFVRDLENREEVAFSKDSCCLESPACLDDDWTLDLPATPIQKWKASTSELLRIIDYFRDTREVYRLVDEDQESKISKMSSQLSYLHFDLRQVLETKIFLPRLSIAENKPCREFKIAGGMYSKFRHIRKNTYHLLFRSSQMEEPVVHVTELIFKKGMLQSFEANTCCQQEGSCWKPLSKTFWEHISFQLGRQMNPLSSVPSDLPLNGQDDELVSWVSIFSSLLLEGLTEDESPPSSNSLVIVISAVFTMTLVSTWPDVFVEERQANSHVCPVILNIWSAVEIAFQHAEYVVSAANFLDPPGSSHVPCLPVKYLNLPLFVNIHSICSEQDVTPLFLHAKKAPPPLLSLMMQSIFSRYHLTDTHQQNEILELCHGIVQLITSHLQVYLIGWYQEGDESCK